MYTLTSLFGQSEREKRLIFQEAAPQPEVKVTPPTTNANVVTLNPDESPAKIPANADPLPGERAALVQQASQETAAAEDTTRQVQALPSANSAAVKQDPTVVAAATGVSDAIGTPAPAPETPAPSAPAADADTTPEASANTPAPAETNGPENSGEAKDPAKAEQIDEYISKNQPDASEEDLVPLRGLLEELSPGTIKSLDGGPPYSTAVVNDLVKAYPDLDDAERSKAQKLFPFMKGDGTEESDTLRDELDKEDTTPERQTEILKKLMNSGNEKAEKEQKEESDLADSLESLGMEGKGAKELAKKIMGIKKIIETFKEVWESIFGKAKPEEAKSGTENADQTNVRTMKNPKKEAKDLSAETGVLQTKMDTKKSELQTMTGTDPETVKKKETVNQEIQALQKELAQKTERIADLNKEHARRADLVKDRFESNKENSLVTSVEMEADGDGLVVTTSVSLKNIIDKGGEKAAALQKALDAFQCSVDSQGSLTTTFGIVHPEVYDEKNDHLNQLLASLVNTGLQAPAGPNNAPANPASGSEAAEQKLSASKYFVDTQLPNVLTRVFEDTAVQKKLQEINSHDYWDGRSRSLGGSKDEMYAQGAKGELADRINGTIQAALIQIDGLSQQGETTVNDAYLSKLVMDLKNVVINSTPDSLSQSAQKQGISSQEQRRRLDMGSNLTAEKMAADIKRIVSGSA